MPVTSTAQIARFVILFAFIADGETAFGEGCVEWAGEAAGMEGDDVYFGLLVFIC